MSNWKVLLLASAIAASLAMPLASANHGLNGTVVGALDDGTAVKASITYVSGNGNTQTWRFAWVTSAGASFTCNGFGSIEIGFVSVSCGTSWSTGATGDAHVFPYGQADVHQIGVTINGVGGTAVQAVCPDSGQASTACRTLAAAL